MNLSIFFTPLNANDFSDITSSDALKNNIEINTKTFPAWETAHLAILSIPEERGTTYNKGTANAATAIRKKFYELKKGRDNFAVVDLGQLRLGDTLQDTYFRLREVCEILITYNVLPVIIGGSHDLMYGQYLAYQNLDSAVCVLNVDAFADIEIGTPSCPADNHVHALFTHEPNYLLNYTLLGYQSYLVSADVIKIIEKIEQKVIRLGQVRENMKEMEPVIREANMVAFDISAIKKQDAPGNAKSQPFGLTGEEACQICWYSGLSERMTSIGFYEYNPDLDSGYQTASTIAIMIWYVIEGYYNRPHEMDFESNAYSKFTVHLLQKNVSELVFYKDNLIEKWWMEVPHSNKQAVSILPCSYSDYETASKGELPYRWIQAYTKLT